MRLCVTRAPMPPCQLRSRVHSGVFASFAPHARARSTSPSLRGPYAPVTKNFSRSTGRVARLLQSREYLLGAASRRPPDPRLERRRAALAFGQLLHPVAHRRMREVGGRGRLAVGRLLLAHRIGREREAQDRGTCDDEVGIRDRRAARLSRGQRAAVSAHSLCDRTRDLGGVPPQRLVHDDGLHAPSHPGPCGFVCRT